MSSCRLRSKPNNKYGIVRLSGLKLMTVVSGRRLFLDIEFLDGKRGQHP